MVTQQSVNEQLKRIGFNQSGWGRTEANELHKILLPDEEIFELVNGYYEGGFAMLVSTDVRVLLVDKKPMHYLTVEDLRFDMINEIDLNHRVIGANISIATGSKTLKFTSLNQDRLRKLIGHVQHCMAQAKKTQTNQAEDQKAHLEQINQQLQTYLMAQHQNQLRMEEIQRAQQSGQPAPPPLEPVKPSPELADFLYAQSLLAQYKQQTGKSDLSAEHPSALLPSQQAEDLYRAGFEEVFGKNTYQPAPLTQPVVPQTAQNRTQLSRINIPNPLEINPLKIAYSKLPMALRNRKFGRPSFHAHSQSEELLEPEV